MPTDIDHTYTSEPTCPNCGGTLGDAWEWCTNEMIGHEEECPKCKAVFRAFPHYDVSYSTQLIRKPDGSLADE